jgi:hypothetical protein
VLELLAAGELQALAALVDPDLGLTFSPYAYVDRSESVVIPGSELLNRWREDPVLNWGAWDGTGEPMALSMSDYFSLFVNRRDYRNAPQVAVNRSFASGNSINNLAAAFPGASWVEFYYPGQDERYGGLDWSALRVVLRPRAGGWSLLALVHDQWTI